MLQRLGWVMDFAGSELQRRDRAGRFRVAGPGFDGFQVVFQWLRQRYRQTLVARTGQVKAPLPPAFADVVYPLSLCLVCKERKTTANHARLFECKR